MCIKSLKYLRRRRRGYFTGVFKNFAYILSNFFVVVSSSQNNYIREGLNGGFHSNERSKKLSMNQLQISHPFRKVTLNPANIYLLKVNHRNSRKRYEICSKLTMKTPKWLHWPRYGVFKLLLTLNIFHTFFLSS